MTKPATRPSTSATVVSSVSATRCSTRSWNGRGCPSARSGRPARARGARRASRGGRGRRSRRRRRSSRDAGSGRSRAEPRISRMGPARAGTSAPGRHRWTRRPRAAVDAVPDGVRPRGEQAGRRQRGGVPLLPDRARARRRAVPGRPPRGDGVRRAEPVPLLARAPDGRAPTGTSRTTSTPRTTRRPRSRLSPRRRSALLRQVVARRGLQRRHEPGLGRWRGDRGPPAPARRPAVGR